MSGIRLTGPSGKARRTKVVKSAYWVPFDRGGEGNWRYLPVGSTHNQMLTDTDEDGNEVKPMDLYAAKGYVPVEHVNDPAALAKLPINWRDVAMKGAKAEYANTEPAKGDDGQKPGAYSPVAAREKALAASGKQS